MTSEEEKEIIRNVPFMQYFTPQQLEEFHAGGRRLELKKDDLIFNEGDAGDTMYIILAGSIEIFKQNKQIAVRGPGDYFGEMAMIESKPRSAGARVMEDTLLFELDHVVFDHFLNSNTRIVKQFLQTISSRCRVDLDIIDSGYLQLFKSEERYRTIIETISDIVFQVNPDGTIEFINSAVKVLGYEPEELIGKHFTTILNEEKTPFLLEDLLTKRIGPRATTNAEVVFRVNEDNPISEFIDEMFFLVDSHGVWNVRNDLVMKKGAAKKFLGTLCIARDFTERKKNEELMERRKDELETLVYERTKVLEQAKKEAEFANEAKTQFLSRVSHELRTPLNAIIGFSELIVEGGLRTSKEKLIGFAQNILDSGRHLLSLITEILDLSRIESDTIQINITDVDMILTLRELVMNIEPEANRYEVTVTNSTQGMDPVYVKADDVKLRQVVLNLLNNALKYNRKGGTVQVCLRTTSGNTAVLEVEDTGVGIPLEDQHKIFEPFQRLKWEYSDIQGTGIGLTICRRLMNLMKGSIGFTSIPDKGSCFFIELPLGKNRTQSPDDAPVENKQTEPAPTSRKTVMYIEDEPINRALIAACLANLEWIDLHTATTAEEGLELAQKLRPDLVLLDILLPGMNGYSAVAEFKKNPVTRDTPIIALTAQAMQDDIEKIKRAQFDSYLTKPVQLQILNETLSRYLK